MTYLLVFFCALALDVLYARWMVTVVQRKPWEAALYSMGIGGAGLIGIASVVTNHWLSLPYLAGLGAGTVLGTKYAPAH